MTQTSMMKHMNMVVLPWCLRRGGVDADLWAASPCEEADQVVVTVGMNECLPAEGCGDQCLILAATMMKWVPAEVLLHPIPVGLAEVVAVHAACPWDTHIEEGKGWTHTNYLFCLIFPLQIMSLALSAALHTCLEKVVFVIITSIFVNLYLYSLMYMWFCFCPFLFFSPHLHFAYRDDRYYDSYRGSDDRSK